VDIVRASFVLSTADFHGDKVLGYESPPCSEVDSVEELEYLEFQLCRQESPVWDYLKTHYMEL
jgi:hypothetical protein